MVSTNILPQVATITAALKTFLTPGQTTEIRAIKVQGARAKTLITADIDKAAQQAAQWDAAGAMGVYFVPNPIRPDLEGSRASCTDTDITERHWLLVDVDPVREAGIMATAWERQAAWDVLCRCRGELESVCGLGGAIVGDSGNGWHLCYPILLPNDEASKELVKAILKGLAKRCNDEHAKVDTSTFNASRIWKLYGTVARKGEPTEERPHRYSGLVAVA